MLDAPPISMIKIKIAETQRCKTSLYTSSRPTVMYFDLYDLPRPHNEQNSIAKQPIH